MTLYEFGQLTAWIMLALYVVAFIAFAASGQSIAKACYFGGCILLQLGIIYMR